MFLFPLSVDLGVFLRDITIANVGNPDLLEDGTVNGEKMAMLACMCLFFFTQLLLCFVLDVFSLLLLYELSAVRMSCLPLFLMLLSMCMCGVCCFMFLSFIVHSI